MARVPIHDGTPLHAVRRFVAHGQIEGVVCPACDQFSKIYVRPLAAHMATALVAIYRQGRTTPVEVQRLQPRLPGGDYAKLRYWDLIVKVGTGWWRVNERGEQFLRGQIKVPQHALIYDNEFIGLDGPLISITEALGQPFDLDSLMGRRMKASPEAITRLRARTRRPRSTS